MQAISYKPNFPQVIERLTRLYARQAQDEILACFQIPSPALDKFAQQYEHAYCPYPDPVERARFWDEHLAERAVLEDDSMPVAYLSEFDQGLYGGVLGGDVRFLAHPDSGWISSMVPPMMNDWDEFENLRFSESNAWFQTYLRQLAIFVEAARGKFGVSHFILIDSLNSVFELIGATRTYECLSECPEMVRRAVELGFEINLKFQETFFAHVPLFHGGTFSNMAQWVPGRVVSESVDPFHMTSVRYFEEWGREPVERILGHFDGGVLHLHGNGRHLLEAVRTVKGLKTLLMADDKGYPPAIEVLGTLRKRAGDLPLVVWTDYPVFLEKFEKHELPGGVLFKVKGTPDADTANRLMEKVRAYRA